MAREIKRRIREELDLVASAGVSYNKFLAKIASDYRKPDGLCTIHPDRALDFIARLPVESFWGVGRVTADKMHRLGIHTGADLRNCSERYLTEHFGKAGRLYSDFAHGIDLRPVQAARIRKSVGCERTFDRDLTLPEDILSELYRLAGRLEQRLERADFHGITLTLKVKFNNFIIRNRCLTADREITESAHIFELADQLARDPELLVYPVRLLGLGVSHPMLERTSAESPQLSFDFQDF